jgi:hypothetical protein
MNIPVCQACRRQPATVTRESEEPTQPYRLCPACDRRLEARALRPLEWFHLAALHSPWKFLLHDDFYADRGIAEQPTEPVETPELFPVPRLGDVAGDLERLLEYAMTRHYFVDETAAAIVAALGQYPGRAVLSMLQSRVAAPQNPHIVARAYEICARVLGRVAEAWIRQQWHDPGLLLPLAEAAAACLPAEEGLAYTIAALDALPLQERIAACQALDWFQSPRALDWIEAHAGDIGTWISPHWGHLAATSHLTWDRVRRWLERGRPLSLVALDALKACGQWDTMIAQVLEPRLHEPGAREIMTRTLQQYATRDPVPRVERDVSWIIAHWDAILSQGNGRGSHTRLPVADEP